MDRTQIRVASYQDLIGKLQQFDTFRVADRSYSADYLIPQLLINAKDLINEASTCGGWVMYWGREAARARRFKAQNEAAYRTWRDRTWLELKATPLESAKLPTDGHTDRLVRMHPEYGQWRGRLDDAQEQAECAEAIQEAFKVKAEMIKAEQRLLHDEAGGAYHVVEDPPTVPVRQPQQN